MRSFPKNKRIKLLRVMGLGVLVFIPGCISVSLIRQSAPEPGRKVRMIVTAYCDCGRCTGWRKSLLPPIRPIFTGGPLKGKPKEVGITASGTQTRKGTIAADTTRYPFGTIMHVPGYGWGTVEDVGIDIKGDHIDVWFSSHEEALRWGRQVLEVTVESNPCRALPKRRN